MKRRKIFLIIPLCIVLVGITLLFSYLLFSKPKSVEKKVKDYLDRYVELDESVVKNIKYDFEDKLTSKQKKKYLSIIKNQYENLEYDIVEVREEGPLKYVNVKIIVYDFRSAYDKANSYIGIYSDSFIVDGKFNNEKAIDYKLDALENSKDKITYLLEFTFQKEQDDYFMNELSDANLRKINGTY